MTVANSTIKKAAKDAFKNNIIKSFIAGIIVLFCYLIVNNISSCIYLVGGNFLAVVASIALNLLLVAPTFLGAIRYYWRLFNEVCDNPVSVFYYFTTKKNYKKAIGITFNLASKTVCYALILYIPYILVSLISNGEIYERLNITAPIWAANFSTISTFLNSFAAIGTIYLMLKYYLTPMLVVADENMDINEAMHMSAVISKSTSLDFIFLVFSMLGWVLLSLLFIPLIYTIPLFIMVYLSHCSFAVSDYNEHIKKLSNQEFPSFTAGV